MVLNYLLIFLFLLVLGHLLSFDVLVFLFVDRPVVFDSLKLQLIILKYPLYSWAIWCSLLLDSNFLFWCWCYSLITFSQDIPIFLSFFLGFLSFLWEFYWSLFICCSFRRATCWIFLANQFVFDIIDEFCWFVQGNFSPFLCFAHWGYQWWLLLLDFICSKASSRSLPCFLRSLPLVLPSRWSQLR